MTLVRIKGNIHVHAVQKLYREAIDQLEEMKRGRQTDRQTDKRKGNQLVSLGVDENTAPAVVATAPSIGQIPMTFSFPMITAPEVSNHK